MRENIDVKKNATELPNQVKTLIERFRQNRDDYNTSSVSYNETQVRREFLDPLFQILGWDISNQEGLSATYKEVIHEDAIKVEGKRKAPDYCFRIGGVRQFFLEAKKPSINVKENAAAAYQLRRYAWSAKLPFSVLSDFEEFAIYDCRPKPSKSDGAATARVLYFTFEDLELHWDTLKSIFSREAVFNGSLTRYADEWKPVKGGAEVDRAFLLEIEKWRESLAHAFAVNNPSLPQPALNFSVQRTIDRIIFIRMCEDRGLENYGKLQNCLNSPNIYQSLLQIFVDADARYNSGLFHFHKERDHTDPPDDLTPKLSIPDAPLRKIIGNLYYPDCPYEFSVLPSDILGQVYEQFLGKVITLPSKGNAVIEEKPEVRKTGGVYYTPTFVVEYIVNSTLGKKLENADPRTIGGMTDNFNPSNAQNSQPLRILDPSCGSGSFLLGAYEYLLSWYHNQYVKSGPQNHTTGKTPKLYSHPTGEWRLTTAEKKRILITHIYGVDIDPQAVETTQLSLLLKVLEGENSETIGKNLELFQERALPDLANNIKCGNSLIGPDYWDHDPSDNLDTDAIARINMFDWRSEFQNVLRDGGFDIIIGNPPYRRERDFKSLLDEIASTEFGKKYHAPRMDLWYYFVHKGINLLKKGGQLSYITNSYWVNGDGSKKLITHIRESSHIEEIVYLDRLPVFRGVSGSHMIFRLKKSKGTTTQIRRVPDPPKEKAFEYIKNIRSFINYEKPREQLFREGKVDIEPPREDLLEKIERGKQLSELGIIRQGIAENPASINKKTNEKFGNRWKTGEGVFALTSDEVAHKRIPKAESVLLKRYHDLSDIGRYYVSDDPSLNLIFSTENTCPDIDNFPTIRDHLKRFKPIMDLRRETLQGTRQWWHLHWPRQEEIWRTPKILNVQMGRRPIFAKAEGECYVGFSVNVFVPNASLSLDSDYILAVLNSRLLWLWFKHNAKRRGIGIEINGNILRRTPIISPNLETRDGKSKHDKVALLARSMGELVRQYRETQTPHIRDSLRRQIDFNNNAIDDCVFDIYGLDDKERAIVQEETME